MFVLDTDVVIWILRRHVKIMRTIEKITAHSAPAVSAMTVAEVYKHIYPAELPMIEEYFDYHAVIPVSTTIAKQAGLYWNDFNKKFKTLSIADCIVAATAQSMNATLVTLNSRHFPMTDIKVVNPLKM